MIDEVFGKRWSSTGSSLAPEDLASHLHGFNKRLLVSFLACFALAIRQLLSFVSRNSR